MTNAERNRLTALAETMGKANRRAAHFAKLRRMAEQMAAENARRQSEVQQ